ncbi:MAG: TldD/PmbA family protein [candidate division Zixibacteria bacterium]|nr:TldD/PmbA family protein [candidate division Zixibacteria bacterium]
MARMSRREFVKAGAKGVALATIPAIFKLNPLTAFATPAKENATLSDYYAHFGVDESLVRQVMAAGLERGGDYCDIFFEHRINSYVGLLDNAVDRAYSDVDLGVGIRVIEGDQTGYSFTEDLSPKAIKLAATTASNIAHEGKSVAAVALEFHPSPDYYPLKTLWEDVGIERKIPYLEKINEKVFSLDKRLVKSEIGFEDEGWYVLIITSEGRVVYDYRPMVTISVNCIAEEKGRREQGYFSLGPRAGIEYFTPERIDQLAGQAVRNTIDLFEAVKPEGGEMEIVLASGNSGILLHEAIGHGMEADCNRKGISIYADKIGKPIAESFVSIIDDGTLPNYRGSINVDDEANPSQKTYLVEDGILKSYMHDRISAGHYKVKPTGNGRRQSFRFAPLPRMRNTYMLPGPHTKEEIIQSVKKGLYAESFTNGAVYIGAGDFTFYVATGRMIENGRLTRPVKDINIIGNGPEVLRNIVMVGNDLKMYEGGGYCGKDGQHVLISDGLPTCKVSSITVGGVAS